MGEALVWGLVGSASLIIGALIVIARRLPSKALGAIMGFGAGVLVSATSFELVDEAASASAAGTAVGFAVGAAVFVGGDALIARLAGHHHDASRPPDPSAGGAGLPIVLGSVLDGIPESAVLGLSLLEGDGIGVAILAAVFISNLPEAMAASSDLLGGGWSRGKVLALWLGITAISGLAAAGGYRLLDGASVDVLAFTLAFAGGAILAMLATTMIPEAYERVGRANGLLVVLGFATAYAIHWLDG